MIRLPILFTLASMTVASGPTLAQETRGFHPSQPFQFDLSTYSETSVVVKFIDDVPMRLENGRLAVASSFANALDLSPYDIALQGTAMERLFSRSVEDLAAERARLLQNLPAGRTPPADLNNYFRVQTTDRAHTIELVRELSSLPLIENAYPEPSLDAAVPLGGGDIAPPTALFESEQAYLDAAPSGHGYNPVRNIVGAQGPDIQVCQQEASWHFDHEDVCDMTLASLVTSVPSPDLDSWKDHGSACVGILTADRNAYGTRGMASQASLILASFEDGGANAISLATAAMNPGDVMTSSWAWGVNGFHAPLDFFQAEWDAVNIATLSGIAYHYGAGNTDSSLDDTSIYGNVYLPGAPDNGGTIVGATNSGDNDKIWFSNFGTRVDCSAWGEDLSTIGYGDRFLPGGDFQQSYTSSFGGTSGAGPTTAAVAASLSNAVRVQNGVQLTAAEIRDAMRTIGSPQGAGGHIGPQADLEALLANFGLPDGLMLDGDGAIGQTFTLEISGPPNSPFVVFLSANRADIPTNINRNWLIDLGSGLIVPNFFTDGAGNASLSTVFPNDGAFVDTSLYFQVLNLDAGGDLHLTNSVELWVRE